MVFHGFININKPSGMTSHDVVARIRRILSMKRVGHTGTLDPQVTGVLPIAVGQATKLAEYVQNAPKTYEGSLVLGIATDTEDISGSILEKRLFDNPLDIQSVQNVMTALTGPMEQQPPMYSAVKVNGKKLYELARKGIEIERKSRMITVYDFCCLGIGQTDIQDERYPVIHFRVRCSKGTYVRTLCVQLGKMLDTPACMFELTRTEAGGFVIEDSISLEQIQQLAVDRHYEQFIQRIDTPLSSMPALHLSQDWSGKLYNGVPYRLCDKENWRQYTDSLGALFRIYDDRGNFFALYKLTSASETCVEWKAEKLFTDAL